MREIRQSGSEGGGTELNRSSLPLSFNDLIFDNLHLSSLRLHGSG